MSDKRTVVERVNEEPVIGHHIEIRLVERYSNLSQQIDEVAEDVDGMEERGPIEWIEIEEGDVDWDETKTVKMKKDTFEKLAGEFL